MESMLKLVKGRMPVAIMPNQNMIAVHTGGL